MSAGQEILRADRLLVILGLGVIAALAWIYIAYLAAGTADMDAGVMSAAAEASTPQMHAWGPVDLLLTFVMWSVMMVAMMVPSAAPVVLMYAAMTRQRGASGAPFAPTTLFLLGYLLVWTAFSAGATGLQWGLHSAALLSPMMVTTSPTLGGLLLAAAGVFQLTPLKRACLSHCRSPLHFFMGEWREGPLGAVAMGVKHGTYCVGCCWVLMALLFVAGVMNLAWVASITVFVLIERVVPGGETVGRIAGLALIVVGVVVGTGAMSLG